MIFVSSNLHKLNLISLFDLKTNIPYYAVYSLVDHCPTILRREHQVIQQNRNIVTLMSIFAHPPFYYAASGGEYNPKRLKIVDVFVMVEYR